jgi:hypothetical protein
MKRLNAVWCVACLLVPSMTSAEVGDNCDDCHATAPVPAEHPALVSTSITGCLVCHAAKTGDSLLESVHAKHVEPGFGCADCHGEPVPERAALDALFEGDQD